MRKILLLVVFVPFLLFGDAFLKIPGIEGGSDEMNHFRWFNVLSYKLGPVVWKKGMGYPSIQARETGTIQNATLSIAIESYQFNPDIYAACAKGEKFDKVIIDVQAYNIAPNRILNYTLTDVYIIAVTIENDPKDQKSKPVETITLSFGKAEWGLTVTPQLKNLAQLRE